MNKVLYIILISLFSLTIISCAKKSSEDTKSTTSSVSFLAVGTLGTILTSPDGTRGLLELLGQQTVFMVLPMEIVPSCQLVIQGQYSPLQMELPGLLGLREHQNNSAESPTETVLSWQ